MSHVVQIVSRRMVLPEPTPWLPSEPDTTIDLTPWDLRMITVEYTQTGVLLPKPPATGEHGHHAPVVERLTSSLAHALGRFYPYAVAPGGEGVSISVSLRCSMEGAEFVHAVAPGVTVADVVAPLYTPGVVQSFFPLNGLLGVDAVAGSHPVLAAQVTELTDGVFVAMSLNHAVDHVHRRWFLDGCRVPIPLPFSKVEDIASYGHSSLVQPQDCFLHFSAESVKKLKAKANAEASGTGIATISSLQALLAHLWVAVCRARRLAPDQSTTYVLLVGSRGRVDGVPAGYAGNAVARAEATSTAGEILERGPGRAASLLNKMVASLDEASERDRLASWARNPSFACVSAPPSALVVTGNSPRFDVYGNDFGWGQPVAVRRSSANKMDGTATVFEGRGAALQVCLAPEVLARLVTDDEFMSAVSTATA
uniref:Putative HCBT-like defense response protein n=1 Tax=Triticum aestivum TaxID=4565 RepID=A0A1I9RHI5_WHEAT|nr:putative HCBT-like defense response protein [Triticum aestivum]